LKKNVVFPRCSVLRDVGRASFTASVGGAAAGKRFARVHAIVVKQGTQSRRLFDRATLPFFQFPPVETPRDERGLVAPALATPAAYTGHLVSDQFQSHRADPSCLLSALDAIRDDVLGHRRRESWWNPVVVLV